MQMLLKGLILPIGRVVSGRVCASSLRSRLVELIEDFILKYTYFYLPNISHGFANSESIMGALPALTQYFQRMLYLHEGILQYQASL